MTLNDLFKKTTYDDTLFNDETKSAIESRIFMKTVRCPKLYLTRRQRLSALTLRNSVSKKMIF